MYLRLGKLDRRWLALQVRVGWEFKSSKSLKERGYEEFLPVYKEQRKWFDRQKMVHVPVFAGYVFVKYDVQNRNPIVTVPGAIRIVGAGNGPTPIPDNEIESLRIASEAGALYEPCEFLQVGDPVRIVNGPLAGLTGSVVRIKGRGRLMVSVGLLMRSVSIELDSLDVASQRDCECVCEA